MTVLPGNRLPFRKTDEFCMKRFPMPAEYIGKSFGLVAGAGFAHQKRSFPPVDIIDIQFEYQGKALVPVGV